MAQIQIEVLCQVVERGFGGTIGQRHGQTPVASHTADQSQVTMPGLQQHRHDSVQQLQSADIVDRQMLLHLQQVERCRALRSVSACAVQHQIRCGTSIGFHRRSGRSHGFGLGDIQRQGQKAAAALCQGVQGSGISGRYDDPSALRMQRLCGSPPYA